MTLQDKLSLAAYANHFDITKKDDYIEIESESSNVAATLDNTGHYEFYVTGVYNNGCDWEEIDMHSLAELREFVRVLMEEDNER